jgi:hypothetical protein
MAKTVFRPIKLSKKGVIFVQFLQCVYGCYTNGTDTLLELYEVMAVPALMHGSEICVLTKGSPRSTELAKMRFLISGKECPKLDKILNHDIRSGFGIYKLTGKIQILYSN